MDETSAFTEKGQERLIFLSCEEQREFHLCEPLADVNLLDPWSL